MKNYSQKAISEEDLHIFEDRARKVFRETPYGKGFEEDTALITLNQGSALHYADKRGWTSKYKGLKDVDIWVFFRKPGFNCRGNARRYRFNENDPENYRDMHMDILGRSIKIEQSDTVEMAVKRWLDEGSSRYFNKLTRGNIWDSINNRPRVWELKEIYPSAWCQSHKAMIGIYPQKYFGKLLWINSKWLPINETKFLVKNFIKPDLIESFRVIKKGEDNRELFKATIELYSYTNGLLTESLWVKYWYQDFTFLEHQLATVNLNGKLVRCDVWNIKTDCARYGYRRIYFYIDI